MPIPMTPEHIHLALNHFPFLGAGLALVPLLVGFVAGHRTTVVAGLLLAALCGWTVPLVMETGEEAYERYNKGPVAGYLDPTADAALEIHEHRAEDWAVALYASAAVSTLCLGIVLWRPKKVRLVALVASVFCAAALGSGIWIAESGGAIRRPDFRAASVGGPAGEVHGAQKEHDE